MASDADTAGQQGAQALRAGDWSAARDAFGQVLARRETPEARDGMARALWWLGDVAAAVHHRTRAFAAFRRRGDLAAAARIAWWLVREYSTVLQNPAAANGWLARAGRLVAATPPGPAHGWVELARAYRSADPAAQQRHARSAYAVARQFDDPDLEIYALARQGLGRIAAGQVAGGITDLDEAMAAAGEAAHLETVGDTLCTVMEAAGLVGDDRFAQWTRALEGFLAQHRHIPLYAFCYTCCGEAATSSGAWEQAETWFTSAIQELERSSHRSRCAHPVTRLALLRIRQGRLTEAESLLAAYRDVPEAADALAALLLAQGQAAAASQVAWRRLAQVGQAALPAVPLLTLLVQARTAEADPDGARQAARRLAELAEVSGLDRVRGLAALAAGRVAGAEGRFDEAAAEFERALIAFETAALPMEGFVARRELARLWAQRRPELAVAEARTAHHGFTRLGARREADETAALLRSLGVRGQTGPRDLGRLSQREREVLELVAQGLTNAEIAGRLFISTKTAGNHVSNVLTKLGVRSRTEAAAVALRRQPPAA